MKLNYKAVSVVLSVALAYDVLAHFENKKRFAELNSRVTSAHKREVYLASMLDRHDIDLEPFDEVALHAL